MKEYIDSLDCSDGVIWHRKSENKKVNEELAVLGYYVKYKFGQDEAISFKLNKEQGKVDGWIFQNGKEIESIQITIAYYTKEEAEVDQRIENGEDITESGWVGEQIYLLKERVGERISKKSKKGYMNIDTLLIGVRNWFVKQINSNSEYSQYKIDMLSYIKPVVNNSNFIDVAIVDTDYVGEGELLIISNKTAQPDRLPCASE